MHTEFRKVKLPAELRQLVAFDHKVFPRSDWFETEDWKLYESYWLLVEGRRIGCCAFERHEDKRNRHLYIASTGILPEFQGRGFGMLMKSWQLAFARQHAFTHLVANSRRSNKAMIALNKHFGFRTVKTIREYYENPTESAVVMVLVVKPLPDAAA
jgi:ribosomal protein S18 acetylase RimI-like enzyme